MTRTKSMAEGNYPQTKEAPRKATPVRDAPKPSKIPIPPAGKK
jgi:hypothetical protein